MIVMAAVAVPKNTAVAMSMPFAALRLAPGRDSNPASEANQEKACDGIDPMTEARRKGDPCPPDHKGAKRTVFWRLDWADNGPAASGRWVGKAADPKRVSKHGI